LEWIGNKQKFGQMTHKPEKNKTKTKEKDTDQF
jgi:hypothetical protein